MTTRVLNVAGMTCEHCRMAVSRALTGLSGVQKVEVNLKDGKVVVDYDDSKLGEAELRQAIEEAGYEVV